MYVLTFLDVQCPLRLRPPHSRRRDYAVYHPKDAGDPNQSILKDCLFMQIFINDWENNTNLHLWIWMKSRTVRIQTQAI